MYLQRCPSSKLALCTPLAVSCLFGAGAEQFDSSWRYGSMPIPLLQHAPTVDGVVGAEEWNRASLFPALVSVDPMPGNGLPPRERTWVWMGYTDRGLYTAWRQDLPPQELPVEPKVTGRRDACEARDNTVNLWFDLNDRNPNNFNFAGNAASQTYDRRHDDGSGTHWNPNIRYRSRVLEKGWEGELEVPFEELGLGGAPKQGTRWACYLYSAWRKGGTRLFAWPYVKWRPRKAGTIVFVGQASALRFERGGARSDGQLRTKLFHRAARSPQSYLANLSSAIEVSQGEGATFESFSSVVASALSGFEPATALSAPGEYLLRYEIMGQDRLVAAGVHPSWIAAPLTLGLTPRYLIAQELAVAAEADSEAARTVEAILDPGGQRQSAATTDRRATLAFATERLSQGNYILTAQARDMHRKVVGKARIPVVKPAPPDWWVNRCGFEPKVPPPWTPVRAEKGAVSVLGRQYRFDTTAVPAQIETRGRQILADPMAFATDRPWDRSTVELAEAQEDSAVYRSESVAGGFTLRVSNRVEFDGFMLIDLELLGKGTIGKLDLVIPFRREHAILVQNYMKASGPGTFAKGGGADPKHPNPYKRGKRFVGLIPEQGLQTPPMITTWIGTDHYGLEWGCESSRGWSMAKYSGSQVR